MSMNRRRGYRACLIVGGMAVGYLLLASLACGAGSLDFLECTGSLHSHHLVLYAPADLSFVVVSLVLFYKSGEPRKTHLTYTGIVATIAVLASFTMFQIPSVSHDAAIFCITMVTLWISLSLTKSLRGALCSWAMVAVFLTSVIVFAYSDHQILVSMLYALFSGGVVLHATGASNLAKYACFGMVVTIILLVVVMADAAVAELGMVPPGYEWLLLFVALDRAAPYADGIIVITSGFFGLVPFVALFTKDGGGPR